MFAVPSIETLNHVAIEVHDLEAALSFYKDIIGLVELKTPEAAYQKGIRWLGLPDGRMLHLVQVSQTTLLHHAHFAMTTPSVQQWREYLHTHGVHEIPATVAVYGAIDRLYFRDPSMNMLEFVQWKKDPTKT